MTDGADGDLFPSAALTNSDEARFVANSPNRQTTAGMVEARSSPRSNAQPCAEEALLHGGRCTVLCGTRFLAPERRCVVSCARLPQPQRTTRLERVATPRQRGVLAGPDAGRGTLDDRATARLTLAGMSWNCCRKSLRYRVCWRLQRFMSQIDAQRRKSADMPPACQTDRHRRFRPAPLHEQRRRKRSDAYQKTAEERRRQRASLLPPGRSTEDFNAAAGIPSMRRWKRRGAADTWQDAAVDDATPAKGPLASGRWCWKRCMFWPDAAGMKAPGSERRHHAL